jgi:hypothetical protein
VKFPGYERVASFATAAEAEVVRGLLAASGIDARVAGTNHLAREHIPSGEIAVLVPAAEVAHAREIIASARAPDAPGAPPRAAGPIPPLWRTAVVVGLSSSVVGALALLLQPGARAAGQAFVVVGALLAVLGALAGSRQRTRRPRRRD